MSNMVDIICLLDESGSMNIMGSEPVDAMHNFISEQKKVDENALFSLYLFNNKIRNLFKDVKLSEVPNFDYRPNNETALYDCIKQAVKDKMETEKKTNVIMVIITDGMDTCSKTSREDVKNLISVQEREHNWQIIYLGANQNVFSVGGSINVNSQRCTPYQQISGGLDSAMRVASAGISRYRRLSQTQQSQEPIDLTPASGTVSSTNSSH